jgi:nicotinate dehydrogenase subunit B
MSCCAVRAPLMPANPAAPTQQASPDMAVDLVSGLPATPEAGAMAWTGTAALPAAAAIANAVFDATGIRLKAPDFQGQLLATRPPRQRTARWGAGLAATVLGALSLWSPWRQAMAPVPKPALPLYSAEAIERGRLVAAAGDCAVCHTAPGGQANAGGLGLPTPFGTIYTTNITPDEKTGIGNWSYEAFRRAMREGIHRDGRHLYPAFPYTAFAKLSDDDLLSLYAYLMSQPAVSAAAPETRLAFPYGLRPGLAVWNGLFHDPGPYQADPAQSTAWNRGAYLVEGAGHCSACHSPRNAMGAEQKGLRQHLGGGEAEGWDAPALNAWSPSPLPWTQQDFYDYLRTGHSARHGPAGGPMAPVIHSLQALPDEDIHAMATYLFSRKSQADDNRMAHSVPTSQPLADAQLAAAKLAPAGARIFEGACASCHDTQGPTLFGAAPNLATNTNLHADSPRNLVRIILDGTHGSHALQVGAMPGFGKVLSDRQITDLTAYMRAAYAPQRPAWNADTAAIQLLRSSAH